MINLTTISGSCKGVRIYPLSGIKGLQFRQDDHASGCDLIVMDEKMCHALRDFLNLRFPPQPVPARPQQGQQPSRQSPNGAQKWEEVTVSDAGHTYRLRVPGGWLYRTVSYVGGLRGDSDHVAAQSTTFVPVPDAVGYAV